MMRRTAEAVRAAEDAGGWGQLYVSRHGEPLLDLAWGAAPSGSTVRPDTLVAWASAVKPSTNVLVMQAWERGEVTPDDLVVDHIPEFGVHGKAQVRLRHLLTHTGHLGGYAGPMNLGPWEDTVGKIIAAPRAPYGAVRGAPPAGAEPPPLGTGSGYNPAGTWILAEIMCRLDAKQRPFWQLIREAVYEPCGMADSWNGIPPEAFRGYGDRLGVRGAEADAAKSQPAGGGIGPTRELGRFYEIMLRGGRLDDSTQLVSPQTVEAMTTPKSVPGAMGIWGFGFNLNADKAYGAGTRSPDAAAAAAPAMGGRNRYGTRASWRAFGHNGATGMQAFADPEHGLVFAAIGRVAGAADAVYDDLELP